MGRGEKQPVYDDETLEKMKRYYRIDNDEDLLKYDMKIFELESMGRKYYIIAGGLLIGKNAWGSQDRIFDYNLNLMHDEIIFQST